MAGSETKYTPILEMVQPLVEQGVTEVPARFIQPEDQRVGASLQAAPGTYQIPIIDMSELDGDRRDQVLAQISSACEEFGFFQVRLALQSVCDFERMIQKIPCQTCANQNIYCAIHITLEISYRTRMRPEAIF